MRSFPWYLPLLAISCLSAQDPGVRIENNVPAKMRDGVVLYGDIYRPTTDGIFPILLQRTPYNRAEATGDLLRIASHGYIVVVQDTRGRYASEGEFYPFRDESNDGYDTIEWAAKLPRSSGQVGMFGGSYVGATQMLAAIAKPPHLAAIFPYVTASEYYDGWTYQNGALMQWFTSSWTAGLVNDTLRRRSDALSNPKAWVTQLPVESIRMVDYPPAAELAPYFSDWLKHETEDDYWRRWKISDHYSEMNVSALHSGGWHDIFLKGTLNNYIGMRKTSPAKAEQRLLIGPWAHTSTSAEGKIGDVTFGKQAVLDMPGEIVTWFDYALKHKQNRFASGAPVRLFTMGENAWHDEQEFPLARTQYTDFFLTKGSLTTAKPSGGDPESYEYDPANPVPTIGGRLCCGPQSAPGPADERGTEKRGDVLVFSTPPLKKDIEVTGWIKLKLYAASAAVDTDFTALLADVEPSGYARFLTDGIVRARYRNSTTKAELLEPGKIYEYTIDLWATSNLFRAGHQIRLYVSSSNFPRFDRNLNTGAGIEGQTKMVTATQRIYHDATHPSSLVLPVIPR